MKLLITGGAGFIGSHLADALIKKGHGVVVVDNLSTGNKKNVNPGAVFYKADICTSAIDAIFKKEKPEIIFHLAAHINLRASVENPANDAKHNILGTVNILEHAKKYGVKKVIFASTGGAMYGQAQKLPTPESHPAIPLSPYGVSKLAAEFYGNYYQQVFKLPFTALRFSNVYGPRQNPKGEAGVVAIFMDAMSKGKNPVIYGDGRQTRDFVHVDDAVDALMLAMQSKKTGIFNIGTGKETDINTIFELVKKEYSLSLEKTYAAAKPGEQQRSCLDFSKAKKELGWQPNYTVGQGIKKTIYAEIL